MYRIFRDASLQEQFEKDGFVKIPLLEPDDVERLRAHYFDLSRDGLLENSVYGISLSFDSQDRSGKQDTIRAIQEVVLPRAEKHLRGWKTHLGGYWAKAPHPDSFVVPHQDWTFIDHEQMGEHFWMTMWIALGDYDSEHGSIGFVKGSHRFFDDIICSPSLAASTPTLGFEKLLLQYASFPKLRAGEAVAFNTRLIHASLPNRSDEHRVAVGIAMTPVEAELCHYFLKPGTTDRVLKLKVDEDFYLEYLGLSNDKLQGCWEAGRVPDHCTLVEELPRRVSQPTAEEIEELCVRHGNVKTDLQVTFPWERDQ